MKTNLLMESYKTFVVPRFGIVLDDKTVPVESIGTISHIGEGRVYIQWKHPKKEEEIRTNVTYDEFWDLLKHEYIIDITKVIKPDKKPLFKVGDLVDNGIEKCCIITSSKYDYKDKKWIYETAKIGDNFKLMYEEFLSDEQDLMLVEDMEYIIEFKGRKYLVFIKEVCHKLTRTS